MKSLKQQFYATRQRYHLKRRRWSAYQRLLAQTGDIEIERGGQSVFETMYLSRMSPPVRFPSATAVLYLTVSITLTTTYSLAFGYFSSTAGIRGFKEDFTLLPFALVCSSLIYYYLKLPGQMHGIIERLIDNQVFESLPIAVHSRIVRVAKSRWTRMAPLVLSVGWLLFAATYAYVINPVSQTSTKLWWEDHILLIFLIYSLFLPPLFALIGLIINLTIYVWFLNSLFKKNAIAVYPLHPDQGGGLGSVGTFSFQLTYLALGVGLWLAGSIIISIMDNKFDYFFTIIMLSLYALLVPLLFYISIRSAHRAMKMYRDKYMSQTAQIYSNLHQSIHSVLSGEPGEISHEVEQLEILQTLADQERKFPVYPFGLGISYGVLANIAIPIATTVAGAILESILD